MRDQSACTFCADIQLDSLHMSGTSQLLGILRDSVEPGNWHIPWVPTPHVYIIYVPCMHISFPHM